MQLYPQIFLNPGTEKLPQQSRLQGLTQRWADTLGKGRQTGENLRVGCHTQTHLRTNHVAEAGRVSHTHIGTHKKMSKHTKSQAASPNTHRRKVVGLHESKHAAEQQRVPQKPLRGTKVGLLAGF